MDEFPKDIWAAQLVGIASGTLDVKAALGRATAKSRAIMMQREAEARYVLGEMELLNGNKTEARTQFQKAVRLCRTCSIACLLATERLRNRKHEQEAN